MSGNLKHFAGAGVVVLGWALAAAALAQDQRAAVLEDVVVTARKVEESAQSVPVSMTVVSSNQLVAEHVKDIRLLQSVSPGLQIRQGTSDPNSSNLIIRGQGAADSVLTVDNSVGVYVDGGYLARIIGVKTLLVDADEIERVEVLRGPQGTLFGRNTTGGAINIVTKEPGPALTGYVGATVGNYGQREGLIGVNLPTGDFGGVRLSILQSDRDGFGRNAAGRKLGDFKVGFYKVRAVFHPTDKYTFDLGGSYQRTGSNGSLFHLRELCGDPGVNCAARATPNGPVIGGNAAVYIATLSPAFQGLGLPAGCATAAEGTATCPAGSDSAAKFAQATNILRGYINAGPYDFGGANKSEGANPRASSDIAMVSFQNTYEVADWLTMKSITAWNKFSRSSPHDLDATPYILSESIVNQDDEQWSEEVQFTAAVGRANYVLGGYYSEEKGDDYSYSIQTPSAASLTALATNPTDLGVLGWTIFDGTVRNTSKAVFGQVNYGLTDRLRVTGGLRYTEEGRRLVSRNRVGGPLIQGNLIPIVAIRPATATAAASAVPALPTTVCQVPVAALDDPAFCEGTFRQKYSSVSWLGSADYQLSDDTLLYAKASKGFKAGGHQLRGTNTGISYLPVQPEVSYQYEAGLKTTFWDRRARINTSAYFTKYNNIQRSTVVPTGIGNGQTTILTNAAKAEIYGGEAEATLLPIDNLTLNASVAYLHAAYTRYFNGNIDLTKQPFGTTGLAPPKWTFFVSAKYVVPTHTGDLSFYGSFRRQTKSLGFIWPTPAQPATCCILYDTTQSEFNPGFNDVTLRVNLNIDSLDASVGVFVLNATKTHISTQGQDFQANGFRTGIVQDPRTWGVEFHKRFGG